MFRPKNPTGGDASRVYGPLSAFIFFVVLALSPLAAAQDEKTKTKKKSRWKWDLELSAREVYDSNVFRLSDRAVDRFERNRPGDRASGRFDDMEEVEDFILNPGAVLVLRGDGLRGKDLRFELGAELLYFLQNPEKSYPGFGFEVIQALGKGRRISLDVEYDYDRFVRNFLADATDLDGRVSASERVYRPGVYDQAEATLEYVHRLWRRKKKKDHFLKDLGFREVVGKVGVRGASRKYDSPHSNRDREELGGLLGLSTQVSKRWRVDIDYNFRYVETDKGFEVMIRDETDFGVDFNGDFDIADENRRTVQRSDRSRTDHSIEVEVVWDFAKRWRARSAYEILYQNYLSEERFDLSYIGREDLRHLFGAELEWEFAKRWSAILEARWVMENSDRRGTGDEDEETEYDRYSIALMFVYQIF